MKLAIFDLDNTLLAGDSDYLWGQFLVKKQIVDSDYYQQRNEFFYDEYKKGTLDILEFLDFQLEPLTRFTMIELKQLHDEFMESEISKIILPKAIELINKHKAQDHAVMIITATNSFVTGPIANALGIDKLIATEPEVVNNRYTGKVSGTPCFQQGKVERFNHWLNAINVPCDATWFYSDSHNDIPLLEKVTTAVAVDPDDKLSAYAKSKGWEEISLRN